MRKGQERRIRTQVCLDKLKSIAAIQNFDRFARVSSMQIWEVQRLGFSMLWVGHCLCTVGCLLVPNMFRSVMPVAFFVSNFRASFGPFGGPFGSPFGGPCCV